MFNYIDATDNEILEYDKVDPEEVEDVARSIGKRLSIEDIWEVIDSYPEERRNDLDGLTKMIIEECIYQLYKD